MGRRRRRHGSTQGSSTRTSESGDPNRVDASRDEVGRDAAGAGADVEVEAVPRAHDAVTEEDAVAERPALVRARARTAPGTGRRPR